MSEQIRTVEIKVKGAVDMPECAKCKRRATYQLVPQSEISNARRVASVSVVPDIHNWVEVRKIEPQATTVLLCDGCAP